MKRINGLKVFLFLLAGLALTNVASAADLSLPPDGSPPNYNILGSWSFNDTNTWVSDYGYTPVSFTNITASLIANGTGLLLDSSDPAWLRYNVYEADGSTNLMVNQGSVSFWFAPSSWSGTNAGGTGLGDWGRLIEVGGYTSDSSYGWWSLYLSPDGANLYFSAQTNNASGNFTNYLSAPVSWRTNEWHFIALNYSATNSSLYLDGVFVTNGLPITVWPGADVLTNGFFIGSDSNGGAQAHGMFDDLRTSDAPMDAATIQEFYILYYFMYCLNPMNQANLVSAAPFDPSYAQATSTTNTPNVITGQGSLQWLGSSANCFTSTNIWMTNTVCALTASNTASFTFTIAGGASGVFYDVFATTSLSSSNGQWAWMGQGNSCNIYSLTNLPAGNVFLILGFPLDSDGDGLTDAYERLVSHTDPHNADPYGSGMPQGWAALLGLDPNSNQSAQTGTRANYLYTPTDWLNTISGIRSGTVGLDFEGNVQQASQ